MPIQSTIEASVALVFAGEQLTKLYANALLWCASSNCSSVVDRPVVRLGMLSIGSESTHQWAVTGTFAY